MLEHEIWSLGGSVLPQHLLQQSIPRQDAMAVSKHKPLRPAGYRYRKQYRDGLRGRDAALGLEAITSDPCTAMLSPAFFAKVRIFACCTTIPGFTKKKEAIAESIWYRSENMCILGSVLSHCQKYFHNGYEISDSTASHGRTATSPPKWLGRPPLAP